MDSPLLQQQQTLPSTFSSPNRIYRTLFSPAPVFALPLVCPPPSHATRQRCVFSLIRILHPTPHTLSPFSSPFPSLYPLLSLLAAATPLPSLPYYPTLPPSLHLSLLPPALSPLCLLSGHVEPRPAHPVLGHRYHRPHSVLRFLRHTRLRCGGRVGSWRNWRRQTLRSPRRCVICRLFFTFAVVCVLSATTVCPPWKKVEQVLLCCCRVFFPVFVLKMAFMVAIPRRGGEKRARERERHGERQRSMVRD